MSSKTRSIYTPDPSVFDATKPGVAIGDLIVDPAGINASGIVKGPNSGRSVVPLGGGGGGPQQSTVAVSSSQPGASGTSLIDISVTDPGPSTPIVGAVVQLYVNSASPLFAGVISGEGSLACSILDADTALSLLVTAITGATGKAQVEVTGTAAANFVYAVVVLDPLPSSTADIGQFKP